jgi:cytochrome P450
MPTATLPPGPKGHFLLGSLPEIRRDELDFLTRCTREYGDIVYVPVVNVPAYVISHPDHIEQVLITNHRNFIKSVYLRESKALFGQGILTSDGPLWLKQRRLLQPAFHQQRVLAYGHTMVDYAERMLETWKDGEVRDIHSDMMRLTMEIIAKVLFGDDMAANTAQVGEALGVFFEQFDDRFGLYSIPEWLPTPGNIRYKRAIARLNELIGGVIKGRMERFHGSGADVLSALLSVQDDEGKRMDETQLRDEMMTLFFTGHETTALALSWSWYLLSQNPHVSARLEEEADRVLGGRMPTVEDIPQLTYTSRVLKESLRMYPPAYGVVREALQDCELGGYTIPKGATLAMFQWVVHRDPRFFESPDEFRPERWDDDFVRNLPRCAYFPFGAGPRLCIGEGFATTEVTLLLAAIASRFHMRLVPDHPVLLSPSLTLRPRKGIKVVVERRNTEKRGALVM